MSTFLFSSKTEFIPATLPVRNLLLFPIAAISSSDTMLLRQKILLLPICAKFQISVPLPKLLLSPMVVSAGSCVPYPKALLLPIFTGEECLLLKLHQLPNLWLSQILATSSNTTPSPKSHGHKNFVLLPRITVLFGIFVPASIVQSTNSSLAEYTSGKVALLMRSPLLLVRLLRAELSKKRGIN